MCVAITDRIGLTDSSTDNGGATAALTVMPAWQLSDLQGNPVSSEDFADKVLLIDFWATWCPPCQAMVPSLVDLQNDYGKDGFEVVAISLGGKGTEEVAAFNRKFNVNYTSLIGDPLVTAVFGDVRFLPTSFLIARDGTILGHHVGQVSREEIEPAIRSALGLE